MAANDDYASTSVTRTNDSFVFSISGFGLYPDFVYRYVEAPLDSTAAQLGRLSKEALAGFREIDGAEAENALAELRRHPLFEETKNDWREVCPSVTLIREDQLRLVGFSGDEKLGETNLKRNPSDTELGEAILKLLPRAPSKAESAAGKAPKKRA